jgi:uncharacterized protein YqeY
VRHRATRILFLGLPSATLHAMSMEQTLRKKLTEAIKARDLRTADIIRMIDTKVMERRTAKDFQGQVDDALYLDVIASYRKTLSKALEEYEALGEKGKEQADALRYEVEYCSQFLPQAMSEDETRAAVRKAIADLGIAKDPKMTGRVTGAVMKEHKGRADAAVVKRVVEQELA